MNLIKKNDVILRYQALKKFMQNKNFHNWLNKWMKVIADYQKLSLSKKTMFKIITDFLNTLNNIYSFFVNYWWSEQRKKTYIIFLEIINEFKNFYTDKILILNFSMFAIWQNKFTDSLKKDNDEENKEQREFNSDMMSCICDSKH